jgi:thymidylate synthase (FAD)
MVAMAAWVSHDQDSEDRLENRVQVEKLINFLYKNKHMSPFEHGTFIFKVDVPFFVAREFHRHRTASYNEVSGRYTLMKPRFWVGAKARVQKGKPGDYYFEDGTPEQTAIYLKSKEKILDLAWEVYEQRLAAGIAKEQAREDLPLSMMTQFYATMNPRNLMQFLTLRNEEHALKEIQEVAVQMEELFAEQMPLTYKAFRSNRTAAEAVVEVDERTEPVAYERGGHIFTPDGKSYTFNNTYVEERAEAERTENAVYNVTISSPKTEEDSKIFAERVIEALDKQKKKKRSIW